MFVVTFRLLMTMNIISNSHSLRNWIGFWSQKRWAEDITGLVFNSLTEKQSDILVENHLKSEERLLVNNNVCIVVKHLCLYSFWLFLMTAHMFFIGGLWRGSCVCLCKVCRKKRFVKCSLFEKLGQRIEKRI